MSTLQKKIESKNDKEIDGNKMTTTKQPIMPTLQKKIESKNDKEIEANMTPKQIGDLPDELGIVIQDFLRPSAIDMERFRRQKIMKDLDERNHLDINTECNIMPLLQNYLINELSNPVTYKTEECIEKQFDTENCIYSKIFGDNPFTYYNTTFTLIDINAIMEFLNDKDLYTDDIDCFQGYINLVVNYMALEFSQYIFDDE